MYIQQHNLQPGDCIAIKRTYDDMLHIVINPDAPANGREVGRLRATVFAALLPATSLCFFPCCCSQCCSALSYLSQ